MTAKRGIFIMAIFILAVVISAFACSGPVKLSSGKKQLLPKANTTFILLRHAEREDKPGESALTPNGRKRAQALAEALKDWSISAIYSPDRGRNRETVQPLADHLGLHVTLVSNKRLLNTKRFADEFVGGVLSTHAGGVVVWVGNKSPVGLWGGNLQEIYKRLGGTGKAPSKYDDLYFIVLTTTGDVEVTKITYGKKAKRFDQ